MKKMKRIGPIIKEAKSRKSDPRVGIDINYEELSKFSETVPIINAMKEIFNQSLRIVAERMERESEVERTRLPLHIVSVSDEDAKDMILRYYIDNHQKETIYVGDISDELNLPFLQVNKIVDSLIKEGIIGVKER